MEGFLWYFGSTNDEKNNSSGAESFHRGYFKKVIKGPLVQEMEVRMGKEEREEKGELLQDKMVGRGKGIPVEKSIDIGLVARF